MSATHECITHIRSCVTSNRATNSANKIAARKSGNAWITTRTELQSMATHTLPASHIIDDDLTAAPPRTARRPLAFLGRLYNAMLEAQMRRAQREVDLRLGPGALAQAFRGELPKER
jgi:hypothetical protein